jgi:hypothetical protein
MLSALRTNGPMTRAALAEATDIAEATIKKTVERSMKNPNGAMFTTVVIDGIGHVALAERRPQ